MSCDCLKTGCECSVRAGTGIRVRGTGSTADPFVISSLVSETGMSMMVADTPSLDLSLIANVLSGKVSIEKLLKVASTAGVSMAISGMGTETSPYTISASLSGIQHVGGKPGDVLTLQTDGVWRPSAAVSAPIGAVSTRLPIMGDGSSQNPIRLTSMTYQQLEALPSSI